MLVERGYILPRFPVIFELLHESTDTDDDMLALSLIIRNSIKLEHITTINRSLNLKRLEQLLAKQPLHLPNIILVFGDSSAKLCFEEGKEEARTDVILNLQHFLEHFSACAQE